MPVSGSEYVRLDEIAVRTSVDLVSRLTADDLDRPTPCAGWTVRDLIAHSIAQHIGFAEAAEGDGGDLAHWKVPALASDFVALYTGAADRVIASFAADGVLDRKMVLAEFGEHNTFPSAQAISFHFIDYVVHSWDLARAAGLPVEFGPDVLGPALEIAERIPDNESRLAPGAPFAPGVPVGPDAPPLDRIVALLGRDPHWSPPA